MEDRFFFDIAINISKRCRREPTVPDLTEDRLFEVEQAVLTQRIFLSNTNSIFDPVGLLTPLTITLKVMLKEMFSKEYELKWEKELPSELKRAWVNVITNLNVEDGVQQEHHALETWLPFLKAANFVAIA